MAGDRERAERDVAPVARATPLPSTGPTAVVDPLVDTILGGQYRIVRPLRAGGMGSVYLAYQTGTPRPVAVKLLHPDVHDADMQRRLQQEAEILARLQHPNIVTVFGAGALPDGRVFLAMEYLEGRTLGEELRRGPMPLPRLLRIAEQLARALVAAHHQGVVHRDLKPDNVMLVETPGEEPDHVKVLDFGIARALLTGDTGLTREGIVLGTPAT